MNPVNICSRLSGLVLLPLLSLVASAPGIALAEDTEVASLIEARQERLESMGRAMKYLRAIAKGEAEADAAKMDRAAALLERYAPEIGSWFPVGSGPESGYETDAQPYIWRNPAKFQAVGEALVPEVQTLVGVVASQDASALPGALKSVGKACKSCHQSFRKD